MKTMTELEEAWAEGLDYFHISWKYHPQYLEFDDGRVYIPDFFLPVQGVCMHVLSEQPDISYYDIQRAAMISGKIFVLAGEFGHFNILNCSEKDSYLCRCAHCGQYFFTAGIPESCHLCHTREVPLTDFWLNGNNEYGVQF